MPCHNIDWSLYKTPLHEHDLDVPVAQWQYWVCHPDHREQNYLVSSAILMSPITSMTYKYIKWGDYYKKTKIRFKLCVNHEFTILSNIFCAASDVICLYRFMRAIFHFTCLSIGDGGSSSNGVFLVNISSSCLFFLLSSISFFSSKS